MCDLFSFDEDMTAQDHGGHFDSWYLITNGNDSLSHEASKVLDIFMEDCLVFTPMFCLHVMICAGRQND